MSFDAPTRGGSIDRFVTRWVAGTLGRKTKEGPLSVGGDERVSVLYSYAEPIASIYDRKFVVVSTSEALSRTSPTTRAHLRTVDWAISPGYGLDPRVFSEPQTATIVLGPIPTDERDWQPILVLFDARNSGLPSGRLRGR